MTFRAVIVGCGSMAKGWIRALQDTTDLRDAVTIVGLVDLNLEAAKSLQAEFGFNDSIIGTNLDATLRATHPNLLFDITVPSARRQSVLTGLNHGCHILTEKPMAESMDDAREMIAAAKAADLIYAVVQNRRYIEGVRRIRQTIESGTLGKLTALHADFFIGAHFGGFRERMQNVLLLDMSIHTLDAARFIVDADPVAVYAQESNPLALGMRMVLQPMRSSNFPTTLFLPIAAHGSLLWNGADRFDARIVADESGFLRPLRDVAVSPAPHPSQTHGHASVMAAFLKAVETGHDPETAGNDNIKSLAMVLAAIESARTRLRIKIAV